MPRRLRLVLTLLALALPTFPASAEDEPGFEALFNSKDFSGWRFGNDVLNGKTEASDGRFKVAERHDPDHRGDQAGPGQDGGDRHRRPFAGDFILRLEFRAGRDANSGLHLRDHEFKHQLQIRDYPRVGPYKELKHYKEGDWNAIEVTVKKTVPTARGPSPAAPATARCWRRPSRSRRRVRSGSSRRRIRSSTATSESVSSIDSVGPGRAANGSFHAGVKNAMMGAGSVRIAKTSANDITGRALASSQGNSFDPADSS